MVTDVKARVAAERALTLSTSLPSVLIPVGINMQINRNNGTVMVTSTLYHPNSITLTKNS
jgi:hypothetical protein